MRIKDIKLLDDGVEQSVAVEFATGEVRTLSAQQLYDAEEFLALRRGRR